MIHFLITLTCIFAFTQKLNAQMDTPSLYFIKMRKGGPLSISAVVSAHIVDSEEECSFKCLEELSCFGFNYNSRISNKYTCKINCQLSDQRLENIEVMNGDDWIFYQVFSIDENRVPKSVDGFYRYGRNLNADNSQFDENCPCNWKKFDGRCYYISKQTAASWSAAQVDCRARGGDLAVPTSTKINNHLFEAMKENNVPLAWIGVYRGTGNVSKTFYTVRGDAASYTRWLHGEPNDYAGQEDCVEMVNKITWVYYGVVQGQWNDCSCSNQHKHYICEIGL